MEAAPDGGEGARVARGAGGPAAACPNCGVPAAAGAAECASCGVVFAKWRPRAERAPAAPAASEEPRISAAYWGGAAALAGLLFVLRDRVRGVLWILDGVDLGVHETGHLVFGLLPGRFLMVLGGTLAQLLMPAAFWWDFRRRKLPRSSDACLIWLGQSLLNVGRYAADARAQELPLVAGGVHDWTYLLETTGLLTHDVGVGRLFDLAGCALMAAAVARIARETRRRAALSAP